MSQVTCIVTLQENDQLKIISNNKEALSIAICSKQSSQLSHAATPVGSVVAPTMSPLPVSTPTSNVFIMEAPTPSKQSFTPTLFNMHPSSLQPPFSTTPVSKMVAPASTPAAINVVVPTMCPPSSMLPPLPAPTVFKTARPRSRLTPVTLFCEECHKQYNMKCSLSNHRTTRRITPPSRKLEEKTMFTCKPCRRIYSSKSSLQLHQTKNFCLRNQSSSLDSFSDISTVDKIVTENTIQNINDRSSTSNIDKTIPVSENTIEIVKNIITYPRTCDKCSQVYDTFLTFLNHLQTCSIVEPVRDASFETADKFMFGDSLKRWRRETEVKPTTSRDLSRVSSTVLPLTPFRPVTLSDREEICDKCDQKFSELCRFFGHTVRGKIHEMKSEETILCDRCGANFSDSKSLKEHSGRDCMREKFPKLCDLSCTDPVSYSSPKKVQESEVKEVNCVVENCEEMFLKRTDVIKHFKNKHKKLIKKEELHFVSLIDFERWKEEMEMKTLSYFSRKASKCTDKRGKLSYFYYTCQFDVRNKTEVVRNKQKKGGLPPLDCPARICVTVLSSSLKVAFYPIHNHTLQRDKHGKVRRSALTGSR